MSTSPINPEASRSSEAGSGVPAGPLETQLLPGVPPAPKESGESFSSRENHADPQVLLEVPARRPPPPKLTVTLSNVPAVEAVLKFVNVTSALWYDAGFADE